MIWTSINLISGVAFFLIFWKIHIIFWICEERVLLIQKIEFIFRIFELLVYNRGNPLSRIIAVNIATLGFHSIFFTQVLTVLLPLIIIFRRWSKSTYISYNILKTKTRSYQLVDHWYPNQNDYNYRTEYEIRRENF